MKKLILPALFLGAIAFTSCKKDYTCDCKINGTTVGTTVINDTKSNAKDKCDEGDQTILGITQECELL